MVKITKLPCWTLIMGLGSVLYMNSASAQFPPPNSYLIDSPFPAIHGGSYRQDNTKYPGLRGEDRIVVDFATTPRNRVSPWLLFSERYPNNSYTIWGSTSTHIFKAVSDLDTFRVVSQYQIDYNPLPNDLSWSFLMLKGHRVLTYDDNILYLFGEEDATNPYSKIVLIKKIELPSNITSVSKLCRLYDGKIAFVSDKGLMGILDDKTFSLLATYQIPLSRKEIAFRNDYAVDEAGNFFLSTSRKMLSVQWNGKTLEEKWTVAMDFGGNRFQGIGTTPTLLGFGDNDRLVSVVDSRTPARMLTFWRDKIPNDWKGLKGVSRRIAAINELPNAEPLNFMNAAVENSPTSYGYEIVAAQYNGFTGQSCNTKKGVYKLSWKSLTNEMRLVWYRDDININSVLIYSSATNSVYGSGRESDCNYYYYTLDWDTGRTIRRDLLGNDPKYDDPGNANIIGADRSIVFNSKKGLVRIRPRGNH